MTEPRARPALDAGISAQEFVRWYWLRSELADFARTLGLPAGGGKQQLTARIARALASTGEHGSADAAVLDADATVLDAETTSRTATKRMPRPTSSRSRLSEPLTTATRIPPGQRSTQQLRAFFLQEIGGAFRFDAAMRAFLLRSDGARTLGDAVVEWHATRDRGETDIAPQFEYNRFTRQWWRDHPDGDRAQLSAAWQVYRGSPVDERASG